MKNDNIQESIAFDCFSYKLKQIRLTLGLSQVDLAKMSGLQPSAISHFETGKRSPSLKNLIRLCRALHCKPNALIDI